MAGYFDPAFIYIYIYILFYVYILYLYLEILQKPLYELFDDFDLNIARMFSSLDLDNRTQKSIIFTIAAS